VVNPHYRTFEKALFWHPTVLLTNDDWYLFARFAVMNRQALLLGVNNEGAMNCGTQPMDVCMPPECPTLVHHRELVCLCAIRLDGALRNVRRPVRIVCTKLFNPMPNKQTKDQMSASSQIWINESTSEIQIQILLKGWQTLNADRTDRKITATKLEQLVRIGTLFTDHRSCFRREHCLGYSIGESDYEKGPPLLRDQNPFPND
jgi:hypothetical protein